MKKIIVFVGFTMCFLSAFCQIDSTMVQTIAQTGFSVITANGNQLIKGVDNSLLSAVGTLLLGFVIRGIEKARLRRKGRLND